jgi:hypothetical protein
MLDPLGPAALQAPAQSDGTCRAVSPRATRRDLPRCKPPRDPTELRSTLTSSAPCPIRWNLPRCKPPLDPTELRLPQP